MIKKRRPNLLSSKTISFNKHKSFIYLVLGFLIFGLLIIANSTVIASTKLYGDPYRFATLQFIWILIGLVGFSFFYNFDYHKLKKFSLIFGGINLFFLIFLASVSFLPCNSSFSMAPCINGANRWFYLNFTSFIKIPLLGVLGFQPGEMAKLAIIMFLPFRLESTNREGNRPFWNYLITCGVVSLLILLQPNMSTAAMVFAIGTVIYFTSEATIKPFFVLFPSIVVLSGLSILLSPYRRARLLTLLSGEDSSGLDAGYHIKQILLALGSGGFWGVGFGQSKQKYSYLPEIASDSIFAIIGEEFGFIGTTVVILAFLYFIYRGYKIALNSPDILGRMMAIGVTSWIALQFFVNAAAMTKLIPLTGVPMPLISYGGSSMFFSLMALGILGNINSQSS